MSDDKYSPEALRKRDADMLRDLDLLRSGWRPRKSDLEATPFLDDWYPIPGPNGSFGLAGICLNHPDLPSGFITTSLIVAISEEDGWVRSMSRFFKLGKRHVPRVKPVEAMIDERPAATSEENSEHDPDDETMSSIPRF